MKHPEQADLNLFVQSQSASNLECLGSQGKWETRPAESSEADLKFKKGIRPLERVQASLELNRVKVTCA